MVLGWRWCIVFTGSRFSDKDFEEFGWGSKYLRHKMEQGTKRRASASRGVDSALRGVDLDQIELAQALRELT